MKLEMTKGYQMVKSELVMKTTWSPELKLSQKKKKEKEKRKCVSGIITIKPHRHDDSKGIVLDFIIMAVLDKNNDIYK